MALRLRNAASCARLLSSPRCGRALFASPLYPGVVVQHAVAPRLAAADCWAHVRTLSTSSRPAVAPFAARLAAAEGRVPAHVRTSSSSTRRPEVAPFAAAAPAPPAPAPAAAPRGMFGKMRALVADYGVAAVGVYTALWLGPLAGLYGTLLINDNFGIDAAQWLVYLPAELTEGLLRAIGVPPGGSLAPWHTSFLLAAVGTDLLEIARFPATLFLAPRVKRAWDAWRAGGATGAVAPPRAL
jgi:hypothetical protein